MVRTAILQQPVTEQRSRSQKPLQCSLPTLGLHLSPSNKSRMQRPAEGWRWRMDDGASLCRGVAANARRRGDRAPRLHPNFWRVRQVLAKYYGGVVQALRVRMW